MSGHKGILGNEIADQLTKEDTMVGFREPKTSCDIVVNAIKQEVRSWLDLLIYFANGKL